MNTCVFFLQLVYHLKTTQKQFHPGVLKVGFTTQAAAQCSSCALRHRRKRSRDSSSCPLRWAFWALRCCSCARKSFKRCPVSVARCFKPLKWMFFFFFFQNWLQKFQMFQIIVGYHGPLFYHLNRCSDENTSARDGAVRSVASWDVDVYVPTRTSVQLMVQQKSLSGSTKWMKQIDEQND